MSWTCPRGFEPTEPKTLLRTTLALRAVNLAAVLDIPGLLEQPHKSKMRKLLEWLYLVTNGLASETWTASCGYGSPHLKEFVFLHTFERRSGGFIDLAIGVTDTSPSKENGQSYRQPTLMHWRRQLRQPSQIPSHKADDVRKHGPRN